MTQSASQAAAFYREVARTKRLWTIKDEGGFPAPLTSEGCRAQPFWSSLSRVERIIASVPAYAGFEAVELAWEEFRDRWVPGLTQDGLKVGVNWSGSRARGYDIEPERVQQSVEAAIADDRVS